MKILLLSLVFLISIPSFADQNQYAQQNMVAKKIAENKARRVTLLENAIELTERNMPSDEYEISLANHRIHTLKFILDVEQKKNINFESLFRKDILISGPSTNYQGPMKVAMFIEKIEEISVMYKTSLEIIVSMNEYLVKKTNFDSDERLKRIKISLDGELLNELEKLK